ncbi:MAG: 2,3,4,5-tetrahydropyridine-2,6-dicarboxylate N-succinyltransferase [Xanthomonadales bacterium]|jgi:2,3,4,5-tetrahydropyridine-2-carboxylate N-succinyltransferase|nr:2,3,4,5-tetrahydropyridine-2,6-dicarboxylate N-succinyltransferase [Xanthomonadales bacterium]MDH4018737.1 2,3,4,5-tetrahydropyridine-2,6-dicarboxylate N-succinyltransferase [Xanthomonadales bacterium]
MSDQRNIIEAAFEERTTITPESARSELLDAIETCISGLEQGSLRVAEPVDGGWQVNEWLKKAVLLYFRVRHNQVIDGSASHYYDKVPLRWAQGADDDISTCGARIVPPATVRRGAFIGHDAVLMPSYVNIGAHVGERSMVDTWATVGSCAQIGEHVHLSGGVGIGGVLEPLQATPTIIEDECFIGARSEVVEGVIIGKGSVLSMGVYIGKSTRIYDRESGEIMYGRVPPGSVVVPGNLPAKDGSYSLYAAIIVKQVDEQTRSKTSVNELLRASVES